MWTLTRLLLPAVCEMSAGRAALFLLALELRSCLRSPVRCRDIDVPGILFSAETEARSVTDSSLTTGLHLAHWPQDYTWLTDHRTTLGSLTTGLHLAHWPQDYTWLTDHRTTLGSLTTGLHLAHWPQDYTWLTDHRTTLGSLTTGLQLAHWPQDYTWLTDHRTTLLMDGESQILCTF